MESVPELRGSHVVVILKHLRFTWFVELDFCHIIEPLVVRAHGPGKLKLRPGLPLTRWHAIHRPIRSSLTAVLTWL